MRGSPQLRCAEGRCAQVGTGLGSLLAHTPSSLKVGEEGLPSELRFSSFQLCLSPSTLLFTPAGNDSSQMTVWLAGSGIPFRKDAEVT